MAKEIYCGFGVDVDAVAGWLGSYGGEDSPDDISRGLFAGEVGSPRLLKLFARLGIKTTWFIPGHSIETFPAEMKAVAVLGKGIEEASLDEWHRLSAVNLTGVFLGTKLAMPALRDRGRTNPHGSAIVNLASVAGLVGSQLDPLYR